jgi:cytochrome c oxidase cbb3-type subunit 4
MDHETLRHFADSWGLLFLVLVFLGALGFAFRPGSRPHQDAARMIPLRDED